MNFPCVPMRARKAASWSSGTALVACLLLTSCKDRDAGVRPDPAFTPYIPAFTAGYIPARAPILVRIAENQTWLDSSQAALQELFELDPGVKGTVSWQGDLTLAFQPNERLASDKTYEVTFHLGRLIEVPSALKDFRFQVSTFKQGIDTRISDLRALSTTDLTWSQLLLAVYTSDDATGQDLEGCFTATQEGRSLHMTWDHEPNGRFHRLLVDSVMRGEQASHVMITWNAERIGSSDKGEKDFEVPAIGDLRLVNSQTFSDGEQKAELIFSDPLDAGQDLAGLAGIANVDQVRLAVEGNKLLLWPQDRLRGKHEAFVAAGLQNVNGKKLGQEITVELEFEELKPSVRMAGTGTILPSTNGLLLPFDAVNLSAVDVRVIKIYADNVAQFLQVNDPGGEQELARVGRLVKKSTVPLRAKDAVDPHRWVRYYLDLDELVQPEPGAIYRVELGFRQEYSLYACEGTDPKAAPLPEGTSITEEDEAQWDNYEGYWYYEGDYYYEDYDYSDRDNPCTPSYYGSRHTVTRNILASDLGLIAKRGNDGSMLVACSDLRTTAPMGGVRIDVLDLQRRSMAQLVTDGEGFITVPSTKHKPFLLVASKGAQRGYLKLSDGNSLSVSEFDVQGEAVDRGLKGFLYGERGVWRPGDSLYLTFVLQDVLNMLPENHPVTLELTDPQGRLDQRHVRTTSVNGTYAFRCATGPEAPTGVWSARVLVGGTSFYRPIRIETVKPNRLKIQLDLGGERLTKASAHDVQLQSNWLHGAPARELKTRVTVTMTRGTPDFKGFNTYSFDDVNTTVNDQEQVAFEGQLDADGHTHFPLELDLNAGAPAVVRANIVTRVFEAGGDASMDRTDVPYYPYVSYAGIKAPEATSYWGNLVTDTTYQFEVVALDADGKPLANHPLETRILKVDRHWWWDGDYDNGYMSAPSTQLRENGTVTTDAKGRAKLKFRVDRPEWGRFVVRVNDPASGHVAAVQAYVDWPGYEGRSMRDEEKSASMLRFNSDKEKYNTGEDCELIIPGPGKGRALVSIESGSRVIDSRWVEITDKETRYKFKVTADMAPNVYAHVTLVQPHSVTDIDDRNSRPIRLYGVIPIMVEDADTHLHPRFSAPEEIRTDQPFTVKVSESDGMPMTYTLAIVDEGLLDLTRFKTPDPWKHFYAREALGVRTWDLYDQVIGAFGRKMERVLALGGSDDGGPADPTKANRFKPVVRFVGPFQLKKGATREHEFTISNYVGSVRVMVVANNGERAYGSTDKAVPVRKPLMLLATLPRVVGPGETVDLPVTLFAMDKKIKDVQLGLETNGLFTVQGPATQRATFNAVGDQVLTFRVKVAERIGVGTVKVTAQGSGETASERIEIQVRQPNLPQTDAVETVVEGGKNWNATPAPLGIEGTNSAYLEVSTIPPVDLGHRLQYLIDYPHGCVEQTTSKAFPQLYLADVMEMPARMQQETRLNVEAAIRKLRRFQNTNGSFNYWPGTSYVDDWCSVYAGHFLIEAERKGFAVPADMRTNWISNQKQAARDWNARTNNGWTYRYSQLLQAYRLYVLSLANAPDILGAMNRLRTDPQLELQARWTLAAAYAIANRNDVAQALVKDLTTSVEPYTQMAYTYGSDLRDEALIAEALMRMGNDAQAAVVVKRISTDLNEGGWYSTQSTAFGLMAVARFAERSKLDSGLSFTLTVNGKSEDRFSKKAIARYDLPVPDGRANVALANKGRNVLYVRLVRTGTPLAGQETASASGLVLDVTYRGTDGRTVDPAALEQGTDFTALVTVAHPGVRGNYQQLALTQVFPSGWEIRNTRMEGTESATQASYFTYQDIRDDRVMTYFDLYAGRTVTYTVNLNASYVGRYYLPPTQCEAMYDHTVNARSTGRWIEVLPPGGAPRAGK